MATKHVKFVFLIVWLALLSRASATIFLAPFPSNVSYSSSARTLTLAVNVPGFYSGNEHGEADFRLYNAAGSLLHHVTMQRGPAISQVQMTIPAGAAVASGYYVRAFTTYAWRGGSPYTDDIDTTPTFSIVHATLVVTWNPPGAITYGTALSAAQLNASANVSGSFAYFPALGTVLGSGGHTISLTFTPSSPNYAVVGRSVQLTVIQAPLTVTATNASKVYGSSNPAFSAAYSGLVNGDTSAVIGGLMVTSAATTASGVGNYAIVPSGATAANYSISHVEGTLTITPATQTAVLNLGATTVAAGSSGAATAPTHTILSFRASGSASGSYTWRINGATQSTTGEALVRGFVSPGVHSISVAAAAAPNYSASAFATLNVSTATGDVASLVSGNGHVLALKNDRTVWTWGSNNAGQLGDGTTTARAAPAQVATLTNVVAVAAAGDHSLALKTDGTMWGWGSNTMAQLTNAASATQTIPFRIQALSGIVAIAAGGGHTLALKEDGTLWSWGSSSYGQVGNGSTSQQNSPVQVLSNVTAAAAGAYHSIAVRTDGTVASWGRNEAGQLGNGTTSNRNSPGTVSGIGNVVRLSAGATHTLALKSDGRVWSWGANAHGQLGDGTTVGRLVPVAVAAVTNAVGIGAGDEHSLAILADGTVYAWGKNDLGQIGDGSGSNRSTPVQVSGLTNVLAVAGHRHHALAVQGNGAVRTWGGDGFGEVSNPDKRLVQAPIRLLSLAGDADEDGMLDQQEVQYFGGTTRTGVGDDDQDGLVDVQELSLGYSPLDYFNGTAPTFTIISGNHQTTLLGRFNALPFDVAIWNAAGTRPLINAPMTFEVMQGGGLLATASAETTSLSSLLNLRSDADGTAQSFYKHPASAYVLSQVQATAGLAQLTFSSLSTAPGDVDGNGLRDAWEMAYFGQIGVNPALDADGDGLNHGQESLHGTNPLAADTDGDGVSDAEEVAIGRDPLERVDGAGLPPNVEIVVKLPDNQYKGVKSDWSIVPVAAP